MVERLQVADLKGRLNVPSEALRYQTCLNVVANVKYIFGTHLYHIECEI